MDRGGGPLFLLHREIQGYGVSYMELDQAEQTSKNTATGLMRSLISIWYGLGEHLVASSTKSLNARVSRYEIFSICVYTSCLLQFSEYCELKYEKASINKLKRDLTSKCGGKQKATQPNYLIVTIINGYSF